MTFSDPNQTLLLSSGSVNAPAVRATDRVMMLVILAAAFASMSPLFKADFVTWDDHLVVAKNPLLNPPTLDGVLHYWREPFYMYIPATYTTWALLAKVAHVERDEVTGIELNPWVFHAFNVFAHAVAALVAYQLLRMFVDRPWAACAGALIFALHPIQVEAVGWISGLKDVMSGMFALLALWWYLRFASADAKGPGTGKTRYIILATAAFVLAMLYKPAAMVLPAIAAWLDYWLLRRPLRRVAMIVVPWLALSFACAVIARIAQPTPTYPDAYVPLYLRPLLAADSLAFYFYKLVWPFDLCVTYDRRAVDMIHRPIIFATWVVPVAIAMALLLWRNRATRYIAAAGVFVLAVLPMLNFAAYAFQDYSITADHYLYVSMFGAAMAVAFAISRLRNLFAIVVATGVILLLGALTFRQARTWRDSRTLFEHALRVNPTSIAALSNLAYVAEEDGRIDDATQYALKAIDAHPDDADGYVSLASVMGRQGQFERAAVLCRRALAIRPDHLQAHYNLAGAMLKLGRYDDAIREYREVLRLNPQWAEAQSNLGALLMIRGEDAEAMEHYRSALKIDPRLPSARRGLAALMQKTHATPSTRPVAR